MKSKHLDEGIYSGVDLAGLNTAFFTDAPGHMMEVKWMMAIYTDGRASP